MKTPRDLAQRATPFFAVLLSASLALGQAVPNQPESPPPAMEGEDEEVIVLSPFEVSTTQNTGYQATDTLAGTRIRTELRDVGSAISVVTKEFMTDLGATDSSSLLQYTTNTEVAGTLGTYAGLGNGATLDESATLLSRSTANRVRGLSAADNTRDFFVTDIPWDSFNVDRIDLQRGPNAMLFGLGKPAGIVNASLRNAAFVTSGEVQVRYGSYGSSRASLDYNQELIDGVLAIRVGGLWDHEKFQQDPAFEDDERMYVALRFDPKLGEDSTTSIKLKYEHGDIDANRPRTVTPMDSVSPWFRSTAVSEDNPFGGMGKYTADNPFDSFANYTNQAGNTQPYLNGANLNAQQPYWLIDGQSGEVYGIRSGIINNGAIRSDGTVAGTADGIPGRRFANAFLGIGNLNDIARDYGLPLASYGQYRAQSMTDPTIFDFYNTLIDGDTKGEFERWDAFNLDLTHTLFDNRFGVQVSYDHQNYLRGGESLLGWQPVIQVDVLERFDDFSNNPNVGRPYVTSNAGGSGTSYESSREYVRASLFGELRASDFLEERSFLAKLLGRHLFNGVYSDEDYRTENRAWQRKAADTAWPAYWTMTSGLTTSIDTRPPYGIIYLGDSIADLSSASGAHIPGVTTSVDLEGGNVYLFDTIWNAPASVLYNDDWDVPEGDLRIAYNMTTPPQTIPDDDGYWQNSNPANYVGWNDDRTIDLWSYDMGADERLLTRKQFARREVTSKAFSWQSFWWNGAVVGTWGWREDEIESLYWKYDQNGANRKILNTTPTYLPLRTESKETTSRGMVVHVNKLFGSDNWLPLNVSFSYNKSSNFEVTDIRNDLYGHPIANPTGATEDYGVLLSTKDGKYSFRALKYESEVKGDSTNLDADGIGGIIVNGLNWRNVFLYDLAAYDWSGRESPSYRNRASNAFPIPAEGADPNTLPWNVAQGSPEEAALENAWITQWNQIQSWLTDRGFFQAWGFTPVPVANLTDRSTYAATLNGGCDPAAQYIPPTGTLYQYSATKPQNFAVTSDVLSKGYEFEFTANPTPSWRISVNAAKTEAIRNNVGGEVIEAFVQYMDSMLFDTEGNAHGVGRTSNGYTEAGNLPRWGGAGNAIGPSVYQPWRANYVRMKLQEGTAVPELRKWRFNVVTNYSFQEGFLKGVGVGGSYRWQDKIAIGYPMIPLTEAEYGFDIANPIYGPSEDAIDLWASYQRKLGDKINWKIQLNIRNAFADDGLIPVSVQPDNTTWAGARVKPVQEWFVTNTFSF